MTALTREMLDKIQVIELRSNDYIVIQLTTDDIDSITFPSSLLDTGRLIILGPGTSMSVLRQESGDK